MSDSDAMHAIVEKNDREECGQTDKHFLAMWFSQRFKICYQVLNNIWN